MVILSKVKERLAELMDEHEETPKSLAEQIAISRSAITRYLQGVRLPSLSNFLALADYFHCSADFLIGLTDEPKYEICYQPAPPFAERFRDLLALKNISQYGLHKKTGLSYDNFNKWLKGKTQPFLDNLLVLSNTLDGSVDYLLGRIK